MNTELKNYSRAVANYEGVLRKIEEIITDSPFKKTYLIEQLGMTRSTFYSKRKHNSFTVHEVKKLLSLISAVN